MSADFPGEIRLLVRAESEGREEWKRSEERKEEDVGVSGVLHKKCQKKILLSCSLALIFIYLYWKVCFSALAFVFFF